MSWRTWIKRAVIGVALAISIVAGAIGVYFARLVRTYVANQEAIHYTLTEIKGCDTCQTGSEYPHHAESICQPHADMMNRAMNGDLDVPDDFDPGDIG